MEKIFIDKEKAMKELKEKLKNKKLADSVRKIGLTNTDFLDAVSTLISLANCFYWKGYQDAQNGGDVIDG